MCDFVSWIEKNGTIWYLTTANIESPRGKELRDFIQWEEVSGHGAIRWFYSLEGGYNQEFTGFDYPSNFPKEIREALVRGEFARWFGDTPIGLLSRDAEKEYCQMLEQEECETQKEEEDLRVKFADGDPQSYSSGLVELREHHILRRSKLRQASWHMFMDPNNRADLWKCIQ